MTDSQIIQGLQLLSIKLVDDMRFQEAEFVDQAIARIMDIPAAVQRMAHPSQNWDETLKFIAKGHYGSLDD